MTHLNALELRLSNERNYLAKAKTADEKAIRKVWVSQIEKEIANEIAFLGKQEPVDVEMSDDDLLAALTA